MVSKIEFPWISMWIFRNSDLQESSLPTWCCFIFVVWKFFSNVGYMLTGRSWWIFLCYCKQMCETCFKGGILMLWRSSVPPIVWSENLHKFQHRFILKHLGRFPMHLVPRGSWAGGSSMNYCLLSLSLVNVFCVMSWYCLANHHA